MTTFFAVRLSDMNQMATYDENSVDELARQNIIRAAVGIARRRVARESTVCKTSNS
jgi:hypothetical protein